MSALRILLGVLLLPFALQGGEVTLPDPPTGQVLDTRGWFEGAARGKLDAELARLRNTHGVDVLVVIWHQALKTDSDLRQLAVRLGNTWSREDQWGVVLQVPGSETPPLAIWGGAMFDADTPVPVEQSLNAAIGRGLKEWTTPARVSGVALNLAEELVFQRLRRQGQLVAQAKQTAADDASAKQTARTLVVRITLLSVGVLLALALAVTGWIRFRARPTERMFPKKDWRRRLGADWSGGAHIVTTFTPTNGNR